MSENRATRRAETAVVKLPHDINIRARIKKGSAGAPGALAYALGVDGVVYYFKTPLDLDGFNPAIGFPCVASGEKLAQPAYIHPREGIDLTRGFYMIETGISKPVRKESDARFISAYLSALALMEWVKEAIVAEVGPSDVSRLKRNLQDFVGNPDMAGQWIKAAGKRAGLGFPKSSFEFWKRVYALIFWNELTKIRTPEKSGKRGGGWDADKAAAQLNLYFRNRHSALGGLEQYVKWKPYTACWLRAFETNSRLSSKAPDGRRK